MNSSQPPWRNSVLKAPGSGRNTTETTSNTGKPVSRSYRRTSPPAPIVPPGPLPPDRDLLEGLNKKPLLQDKISVPKHDEDQKDVCVKDYTYIGSYNWMKSETPTILVPGQIENLPLPLYCSDLFLNRFPASVVESVTAVHHTT